MSKINRRSFIKSFLLLFLIFQPITSGFPTNNSKINKKKKLINFQKFGWLKRMIVNNISKILNKNFYVIIIGSGPAGISTALQLEKKKK